MTNESKKLLVLAGNIQQYQGYIRENKDIFSSLGIRAIYVPAKSLSFMGSLTATLFA